MNKSKASPSVTALINYAHHLGIDIDYGVPPNAWGLSFTVNESVSEKNLKRFLIFFNEVDTSVELTKEFRELYY
jgi:hypothetical protein